jgi:hypothetical protein
MCSPCFVRASFANKKNSTAEVRGSGAQCLRAGLGLTRSVHIYAAPLYISRLALLLPHQRRAAAGYGLGSTIEHLRRTTSSAAGGGLGATAN